MTEEDEEFNRIERESAMRQESVRATMLAEQPEQKRPQNCGTGYCSCIECVMEPAQQEPVAWMFQHEETGRMMCVDAQQVELGFEKFNPRLKKIAPLYTSPPAQRTWVGLLWGNLPEDGQNHDFLRGAVWAEAKLKELNT